MFSVTNQILKQSIYYEKKSFMTKNVKVYVTFGIRNYVQIFQTLKNIITYSNKISLKARHIKLSNDLSN